MVQKSFMLIILFGIFSLFFITGCGKGDTDAISAASPFLGGSQGIEIKFLDGAPPDEITDGNTFPFRIVLSIKNEGEFDLDNANKVRVDLKGILPADFNALDSDIKNLNPESAPNARKKDSEGNIIEAVETFATIPRSKDLSLLPNKISGNTEFTFRADVCYQYGTNAISKICILENMISPPDDAICNPRGDKKVFSSSSPVQITKFRQTVAAENKIQFSFDIVHSGQGNVFKNVDISPSSCPKDSANRRSQEDTIGVKVTTGLNGNLECIGLNPGTVTSIGEVKLVDNKRTITCTQTLTSRTDLERNVDIELKFDYSDSIDKKVLAKHLKEITTTTTTTTGGGGVTLPTCGGIGAPSSSVCRNALCNTLTSCASTTLCTCSSGEFSCVGGCTSVGDKDITNPTIGKIEPGFAIVRKDASDPSKFVAVPQFFVIQDVFDAGGIKSCKLVNTASGEVISMDSQGPALCKDVGFKCDFVGQMGFTKRDTFGLKAICEDSSGNPKDETGSVLVKNKITEDVPIPDADNTPPKIGELVTDVAAVDETIKLIVVGVEDPESGIDSCKFVIPGGIDDARAEPLPYDGSRKGLIRDMSPEGPRPCLGGGKGEDHGACSFWITHTFVDKELTKLGNGESQAKTTDAVIHCTNRAKLPTKPALSKQLPVTIKVQ